MSLLILVSVSRSPNGLMTRPRRHAPHVLRRASDLAQVVLCDPCPRPRPRVPASALEPRSRRRPGPARPRSTEEVKDQALRSALRWSPRVWTMARSACTTRCSAMGLDPVPSIVVVGPDLPSGRRGAARAEEEAAINVAPVRLSSPERVLAARWHRVRAERRSPVRGPAADRRPLPLRPRFPRRMGRDLRSRDHGLRQGRRCSRVPQRLLSDNGRAQPVTRCPRQLRECTCVDWGEPITGKPLQPTTEGKTELFHQTLFRYLDKQPLASTLAELQAQVDAFNHLYNTQRPHQRLPGRVTPLQAWEPTANAEAPRPTLDRFPAPAPTRPQPAPVPSDLPEDTILKKLSTSGTFILDIVTYNVGAPHGFEQVLSSPTATRSPSPTCDGVILIEHTRPAPGITYVGNGRPRRPLPASSPIVTEVLRHQLSPMS